MNKFQEQQAEFLRMFGKTVLDKPTEPDAKDLVRSANLVEEEAYKEFVTHARMMAIRNIPMDLVQLYDDLIDTIVVCCDAANHFGLDLEPGYSAVMENNMAKIWTDEEVEAGIPDGCKAEKIDGLFGWRVLRADGKIIKPPNHPKVDLKRIVDRLRAVK